MIENVILVDVNDNEIGFMPKMEAHLQGHLHRAFSIFIFNTNGELLLQQRALNKYHSGGKWTNTCCSHPRLGEKLEAAAKRRLLEEMGMECELKCVFNFLYKASITEEIFEHEYDHVFFGISNTIPIPQPMEVANFKYVSLQNLAIDLNKNPDDYSAWLKICFSQVLAYYFKNVLNNELLVN